MQPLAIAVAQPPSHPYDVAANARVHAEVVRAAGARVVVFPELSLTGYHLDAPTLDPADPRLEPLVAACAETGALALAGAPVDGPHIAVLAVDGSGASVAYRKMWLGEQEARRFRPGATPGVLTVDGRRLGLAVCKDTMTEQHAADTAAAGVDAYVAGTLKPDTLADAQWDRAREIAVEHGLWVAVASFAGSTGEGFTSAAGRSAVWSPTGELVASVGPEAGAIARATFA